MTSCRDDIETFSRLDKALVDLLLAPAKDPASSPKNVGRKELMHKINDALEDEAQVEVDESSEESDDFEK